MDHFEPERLERERRYDSIKRVLDACIARIGERFDGDVWASVFAEHERPDARDVNPTLIVECVAVRAQRARGVTPQLGAIIARGERLLRRSSARDAEAQH